MTRKEFIWTSRSFSSFLSVYHFLVASQFKACACTTVQDHTYRMSTVKLTDPGMTLTTPGHTDRLPTVQTVLSSTSTVGAWVLMGVCMY